ncbi:MAG TPA: GNAT family N-acetyltransferase [Geminicoccaceae bacterium]|nr:GNAT family N-acetyltransferase [Geminicoccaceae bacterium]
MTLRIRPATVADAATVAALAAELGRELDREAARLDAAAVRRDGFGPEPAFAVMLAFLGAEPAGYALFHDAYESPHAARGCYIVDLWVRPEARRRGIGRGLVAAVAREAKRRGAVYLWWASAPDNRPAHNFYRALGASAEPVMAHALTFDAFDRLSDEAARGAVVCLDHDPEGAGP